MTYYSVHTHSRYSALDGMTPVQQLVEKAHSLGHPAMGLTDHGNMAGIYQLYKATRALDMAAFPGSELYIVDDHLNTKAKRYHVGLLALDYEGYMALVKLSSMSFTRPHFHIKPRIDMADLAALYESGATKHLALTTGCFFGLVVQALVNRGKPAAMAVLRSYASWFPNTFVEIQHHNTEHKQNAGWDDTRIAVALHKMAAELGLPTIITQDCHYCDLGDRHTHTFMKRLVIHGADDPGDVGFPGDSYHMAGSKFIKAHFDQPKLRAVWNDSLATYDHLLSLNKLSIPALDTYQFRVPEISKKPDRDLASLTYNAFDKLDLKGTKLKTYDARIDEELDVIKDTGFANYFLLNYEIVQHAHSEGIIMQARGSANGSLVCWLLGITDTDPIEWDIPFATFLTKDRSKPPDIDHDIEKGRRKELIAWVGKRFPNTAIGTWAKFGFDEEKDKGNIPQKYMGARRRELGDAGWAAKYPNGLKPWMIEKYEPEDYESMMDLDAMHVLEKAGTHAAGYVLDSDGELFNVVPSMLIASSDNTVTQWEMDDIEAAGFLKVDLLGLRTLSSMNRTLQLMGEEWPFLKTLPLNDTSVYKAISQAEPFNGMFQLEGYTTAREVRKMKPKKIKEVIEAMALFRPACMYSDLGDGRSATRTYLDNRRYPEGIRYLHDVTEHHLKETYGVALYSEQILGMCKDLGMTPEDVQKLVQAAKVKHGKAGVSAASTAAFEAAETDFIQTCRDAGVSAPNAKSLWNLIVGFQKYGFKKAHATPYGLLAYRSAYLKHHYPREFHAALLETISWANPDREPDYEKVVRRLSRRMREQNDPQAIRIASADVNLSGATWTLDSTGLIRRGLLSIKQVGIGAASALADGAPYADLEDMFARLPAKIVNGGKSYAKTGELGGTYKALRQAGALESIGIDPLKED